LAITLVFRIGIARRATIALVPGTDSSERIFQFMETQGAAWGARREVIYRATAALNEVFESVTAHRLAKGPVQAAVTFDEMSIDVRMQYEGQPLDLAAKKRVEQSVSHDGVEDLAELSTRLIRQYTDRVKSEAQNGSADISLHFDH
jgi:NCS2 family nucleobase:cation symporter-2